MTAGDAGPGILFSSEFRDRLPDLNRLTALRDLSVHTAIKAEDIGKFSDLPLKRLSVTVSDPENLVLNFPKLRELTLSAENKYAITPLERACSGEYPGKPIRMSACTELEKLRVVGFGCFDLEGLRGSVRLKSLTLTDCLIHDISHLAPLKRLEHLCLSHNNISDASPLLQLTKLKFIDLSYNDLTETADIERLPELDYLNLYENFITSGKVGMNFFGEHLIIGGDDRNKEQLKNAVSSLKLRAVQYYKCFEKKYSEMINKDAPTFFEQTLIKKFKEKTERQHVEDFIKELFKTELLKFGSAKYYKGIYNDPGYKGYFIGYSVKTYPFLRDLIDISN